MAKTRIPGSFRDPSGFVFTEKGKVLRQVNLSYKNEYDKLMSSGLYEELVDKNLLVKHKEIKRPTSDKNAYKFLQPERIGFISFPYEWSFSQLKDAALLTLEIQQIAMKHGMSLKDASSFNIQFLRGRPVFIDTLSFEITERPKPWVAYKQYCQHFLAPLSLMAHVDVSLSQLLRANIDGIPLDVAAKLLPAKTRLSFGLLTHIRMHARSQQKYSASAKQDVKERTISETSLKGIINNLVSTTRKLTWKPAKTEWGGGR